MKYAKSILATTAALAVLLSGPALAQQTEPEKRKPIEFKELDSDRVRKLSKTEESKKAASEMTPRERMARFLGTWEVQGQVWIASDAEPILTNGTAISEMALEDTFLHTRFKGEMMGETFVGVGYETWDEARQKQVGVWIDSQGTEIFTYEGEWDASGNVLTVYGRRFDPDTKKTFKTKGVTTFRSSSMYTYEASFQTEDGEWAKTMDAIFGKLK